MYTKWLLVLCFVYFSLNISSCEDSGDPPIDSIKPTDSITKKSNKVTTVTLPSSTTPAPKPAVTVVNATKCAKNDSDCQENGGIWKKIQDNKGMLLRTLYVLIGITSIVIIYFVLRAWRLRRRRSKSRKYGLITSRSTDLEMAPLDDDDDDDDEDMTVYEHHKLRK